jgi:four helix bundle protein
MATIRSHRDLNVWQESVALVEKCYRTTSLFPRDERFGLSQQLQRAAVSVPANIAEGQGRDHLREYLHHLSIAYGSLMEVDAHIEVAWRVGFIDDANKQELLDQIGLVGRLLNGLQRSLRKCESTHQNQVASLGPFDLTPDPRPLT